MGSLILKLVYILTAWSIAADLLHFWGFRFNAEQYGAEISAQSSGLFLPGANGAPAAPALIRILGTLIKIYMETEGDPDNEAGETKNKEKKSNGNAGMLYEEETILSTLNARLHP